MNMYSVFCIGPDVKKNKNDMLLVIGYSSYAL